MIYKPDRINIRNLEVFAHHGVYPEENTLGQMFLISASLYMDLRNAGKTDDLTRSISYVDICREIKKFAEENTFSLIEAIAERLAEKLLTENPWLDRVWLEIKKPWAPVAVHLETVSVEIERGWHTAYIALGSNIGDRKGRLDFAVSALETERECRVTRVSGFIATAPYGYTDQDHFLNGCLELKTLLTPPELLDRLHSIEDSAGRERAERWGPRTLDLDIIFYDDLVMSDAALTIPHADMHRRDFVLAPLYEIAPGHVHPVFNKTIAALLGELKAEK